MWQDTKGVLMGEPPATGSADLRSFLAHLESVPGERVARVPRRVSSVHELSAVVKLMETRGNPVLLFEDVDGLGIPVVCGLFATRKRVAMALGTTPERATETFLGLLDKQATPLQVSGGPVQEVRLTGGDASLKRLPIPVHAPKDGGPYITAGVCLVRDPVSGAHNAGIYRMMVQAEDRMTVDTDPAHDLGKVIQWGMERSAPVDVAIVIGGHPALHVASQAKVPIWVDSLGLMGSLLGRPVPVTRCISVDLEVPAHAEIVIEGQIVPGQRMAEGPFGEFSYYYGASPRSPVCMVTAITHRRDPIYLDIHPTHSDHRCLWLFPGREARLLAMLRQAIPGVQGVHLPLDGAGMVACISLDKAHDGDVRRALMIALSSDVYLKHAMIFDPDINIYDLGHVLWALAVRFQADTDLMVVPFSRGFQEDPSSYSLASRLQRGGLTTKTGFDATAPLGAPHAERADVLPPEYASLNLDDYVAGEAGGQRPAPLTGGWRP
jgi:2,5-furandicarboxylate decarboxylase 1